MGSGSGITMPSLGNCNAWPATNVKFQLSDSERLCVTCRRGDEIRGDMLWQH